MANLKLKKEEKKKMPSAIWVRYYTSLVALAVILVAVIGWFLVIGPAYSEYSAINLEPKQQEQEQLQDALDKFNQIVKDWDAVSEQDKKRLTYFLPTEQDIPGLIAILDETAQQSGFMASKVTLTYVDQPVFPNSDIYPILLSASIQGGGYRELKNFINKIETNLRLMDLNSLSFQTEGESYLINLAAYYLNK